MGVDDISIDLDLRIEEETWRSQNGFNDDVDYCGFVIPSDVPLETSFQLEYMLRVNRGPYRLHHDSLAAVVIVPTPDFYLQGSVSFNSV